MMCSISNHATTKSCLNHPVNQFVRTVRKHIVPVRLLTVAKFIQMDTINIQMKLKHTDPIRHLPWKPPRLYHISPFTWTWGLNETAGFAPCDLKQSHTLNDHHSCPNKLERETRAKLGSNDTRRSNTSTAIRARPRARSNIPQSATRASRVGGEITTPEAGSGRSERERERRERLARSGGSEGGELTSLNWRRPSSPR
jgi:hypothetical protein